MSDESQPPPLRLRPRARTEESATPAPSVTPEPELAPPVESMPPPVIPSAPIAASEPIPRLRLKPKLMAETEPAATVSVSSSESAPVTAPLVPPASKAEPPPVVSSAVSEMPRLKLKPLLPTTASSEASPSLVPEQVTLPEGMPLESMSALMPPPLPIAPEEPPTTQPTLRPLPVLKMDAQPIPAITGVLGGTSTSAPFKPPAKSSRLSVGRIVGVLALFLLLGGGGYYGYHVFPGRKPAPTVVVTAPPVVAPAIPLPAPPEPEPLPKTSDVASIPSPQPVTLGVVVPVKPLPPRVPATPPPGVAFLNWIDTVKISGVFNGSPARAIVNGLLVRQGDTIDSARGIVFDHIDPVQKEFFFRDRSGAIASKPY